jgi:PncC family amidohydrolase
LVTYSDAAKESLAGVSAKTLKAHSAVSAETAREMAEGGAKKAGASAALSATGYAGPPAGPEDDTVGRVFLGCFYRGSTEVEEHQYAGSRNQVRGKARDDALRMLRRRLSDE